MIDQKVLEAAKEIVACKDNLARAIHMSDVPSSEIVKVAEAYIALAKHLPSVIPVPVTLFAVHEGDSDRDSGTPKWYFDTKLEAQDVAEGRGWYGGNSPISQVSALKVGNQAYILRQTEPVTINDGPIDTADRKAQALAKLSPMDRKILGLK